MATRGSPLPSFQLEGRRAKLREGEGGTTEKWCSSCTTWKPLSEYNRNVSEKSGIRWCCKACDRERRQQYEARKRAERQAQIAEQQRRGLKFCGGCDRELPLDQFSRCAQAGDGLQTECRECHSLRAAAERDPWAELPIFGPKWTEDEFAWKAKAACRDKPSEWWFKIKPVTKTRFSNDNEQARAICATCPVLRQCRNFVDELEAPFAGLSVRTQTRNMFGIWAGETPQERIRRRQAIAADAA